MAIDPNHKRTPEDQRIINALADMFREAKNTQVDPLAKWSAPHTPATLASTRPRRVTSRWVNWKHNRRR